MPLPTTANVTRPRASGYSFRIDNTYLRGSIAPDRPLDITTADLQAPKINTASSGEDLRNDYGEIFSREAFIGGEGLDFAHQRSTVGSAINPLPLAAPDRFWDSKHIDISNPSPGQPAKITLLPTTATIDSSASSNLHLAYDGSSLHMATGSAGNVRKSANPTATTPTFADDATGAAVAVTDMTSLGTDVYAAFGASGIYKLASGTWSNLASATTTQKLWAAKLLLLGSTGTTGSILAEINTGTGAATTRVTLPTGQSWLDVADCGLATLACASDGNVYALTSVSGVLTLQAQTPMPNGEVPYCVGFDGTYVFIGTREVTPNGAIGRMYRMELASTYVLGNAQLLRQWGDQSATVDQAPRRIVPNRKGVIWGIYETAGAFLWRYDSASAGVSRHLDLGASGLVVDLLAVSGRIYATVAATGLRREQVGTYESNGYLIGPLGDFFNASQKSWAGALMDQDSVTPDARIELYYTTDPSALMNSGSSSWVLAKRIETGQDVTETPLRSVDARYLAGMVKLYANTAATATPAVRSFAFRAYPGPGDVELALAVNTSDVLTKPGGRPVRIRGLGDMVYDYLKGKEGRYAELEVLATGELFRGVVKQVATRIPDETHRGSPSVVSMVTFRGRRVDNTDLAQGLWGTSSFGLATFGGLAS